MIKFNSLKISFVESNSRPTFHDSVGCINPRMTFKLYSNSFSIKFIQIVSCETAHVNEQKEEHGEVYPQDPNSGLG